ncbi:hypothetical protein Mal4_09070 [Maioricimonas rarisocia]|uniref:DUF4240 domain-containing protein n=1 Tax=Maioricimonas rarisocia TaxID=2528026 RepID=A0A517Z2C3_9PLAN|nr:DUF4240 domain-containing protein [Maioricimonas rarisocia]QDU36620.1 hypothetical protein Mal4_09070 [Maioricimonas rarisocia]
MDRDVFWKLIEQGREASAGDCEDQAAWLQRELEKLPPEEILDFQRHFRDMEVESYGWNLWGAAYLINGGCSDDGFDYFRGWLIAQGRGAFEQALADPDSLVDLPQLEEDVECEDILYVGYTAYRQVTGDDPPPVERELPDLGDDWDFDDDDEMRTRYPKLFAKFCED